MSAVTEDASAPVITPSLERIVLAQAEQEKLADKIQPWMIRITRALLSQMLDPEFPHRHLARSVEATLWQLEEDWAARHNRMSDAEADSIIEKVFPEHAS